MASLGLWTYLTVRIVSLYTYRNLKFKISDIRLFTIFFFKMLIASTQKNLVLLFFLAVYWANIYEKTNSPAKTDPVFRHEVVEWRPTVSNISSGCKKWLKI